MAGSYFAENITLFMKHDRFLLERVCNEIIELTTEIIPAREFTPII
jgi:ATPase subunit of ABC transporter with duplicated ATPase domains